MTETLIWRYGCVRCQIHHYKGDKLYDEHYMLHDKHGSQQVAASVLQFRRSGYDCNDCRDGKTDCTCGILTPSPLPIAGQSVGK